MILNIRVDHKTANIGTMERSAQKLDVAFQEILEKYPESTFLPLTEQSGSVTLIVPFLFEGVFVVFAIYL